MNIIFDLDGTLIDSSERMYHLFNTLIPQSYFSKEEYWNLKRNKVNHKMLLNKFFPDVEFEKFNARWMKEIEKEEYLSRDQLYADTLRVLTSLSEEYELYLLTARQSKGNLIKELDRFGLTYYFKEILTTESKYTKEQLLQTYCKINPEFNNTIRFFVSDMGSDISLGNKMGYCTVAISHGFMNKQCLREYSPTYIIDELSELSTLVDSHQTCAKKKTISY